MTPVRKSANYVYDLTDSAVDLLMKMDAAEAPEKSQSS